MDAILAVVITAALMIVIGGFTIGLFSLLPMEIKRSILRAIDAEELLKMEKEKTCCDQLENQQLKWALNRFEDWEPHYSYCKVCGKVLEEHTVTGRRNLYGA